MIFNSVYIHIIKQICIKTFISHCTLSYLTTVLKFGAHIITFKLLTFFDIIMIWLYKVFIFSVITVNQQWVVVICSTLLHMLQTTTGQRGNLKKVSFNNMLWLIWLLYVMVNNGLKNWIVLVYNSSLIKSIASVTTCEMEAYVFPPGVYLQFVCLFLFFISSRAICSSHNFF